MLKHSIPDPVNVTNPPDDPNAGQDLRRLTEEWIEKNPELYDQLKTYAVEEMMKGKRFGIGFLVERLRFECRLKSDGSEPFKISNSYRAYLARKLCSEIIGLDRLMVFHTTKW